VTHTHRHAWGHCWIISIHPRGSGGFPVKLFRHILDHPDKVTHVEQMGKKHWVVWILSLRLDIVWHAAPKGIWYE